MSDITKEELLSVMDRSLFEMAFLDIERASSGGSKMGAFILSCCFVDALAGFFHGVNKNESRSKSGYRFKGFVNAYLTQYDSEKLWSDLRCGLVHAYASGQAYVYTDNNKAGRHFDKTTEGYIILNLEDFISDIRNAFRKFCQDIKESDDLFDKAKRRFESIGLMGIIPVQRIITGK